MKETTVKNTEKYKELYKKIEKIVRDDGDETLDIEWFIDKMIKELSINNIYFVSNVNGIPEDILEELKELSKIDNQ